MHNEQQTAWQLHTPPGTRLVQWETHLELHFEKGREQEMLQWLRDQAAYCEVQAYHAANPEVRVPCTYCTRGQIMVNGTPQVCGMCHGSGMMLSIDAIEPAPTTERSRNSNPMTTEAPAPVVHVIPDNE